MHLVAACLLATSIAAWAHAAEHAGASELAGACDTCNWAKHSPAVRAAALVIVAQPMLRVAAPSAPIHPDIVTPRAPAIGRAPPAV